MIIICVISDYVISHRCSYILLRNEKKQLDKAIALKAFIRWGSLTIENLGEIVYDRPEYHSYDMLFPANFRTHRMHWDTKKYARVLNVYEELFFQKGFYLWI